MRGSSKSGEYLEHEKYVCGLLNLNLKLNPPLQVNDIDTAHPLPAKNNNCSVIVKFLRRSQRNYIFSQKRLLKGKQMIIIESLTKRRLQFLEAARDVFGWRSVWSFNGHVYARGVQHTASGPQHGPRHLFTWPATDFIAY